MTPSFFQGTVSLIPMLSLLKKHFGYDAFRPLQEEIITHCLAKKDALVLMPTGGGKSLCYQLPALVFPGLTVVVSPLIALMKDQVDALRANGVTAAFLNSTLNAKEQAHVEREAREGKIKLLYLAPERLLTSSTLAFLRELPLSLLAIDEAHCISEWGHDFRPEYRELRTVRHLFPRVPLIALTATANVRVRKDIIEQLGLDEGRVFQSSFNRPNLRYRVLPKKEALSLLLPEIQARSGESMIVYCFSRKSTEKVAETLCAHGFSAAAYHAGLSPEKRARLQEDFIHDRTPIIVATIAFGMGIDKPDVRLVVHMDLPKSVEGYYQETGRAGRDGLPSDCLLFFSKGDCFKQELFIKELSDPKERLQARIQLQQITQYGEQKSCRRAFLLAYFGEAWPHTQCDGCDICVPSLNAPLPAFANPSSITNSRSKQTKKSTTPSLFDETLFEELRLQRRILAGQRGVPPYILFGDRTLQEMASFYPQSMDSLGQVFGVGKEKLKQYGELFLKTIQIYTRKHNLKEKLRAPVSTKNPPPKTQSSSGTVTETLELFRQRKPLKQIAEERGLSLDTILSHLEHALDLELPMDTAHLGFSSRERFEQIANLFAEKRTTLLGPIRVAIKNTASFQEIRYIRFLLRARRDPRIS